VLFFLLNVGKVQFKVLNTTLKSKYIEQNFKCLMIELTSAGFRRQKMKMGNPLGEREVVKMDDPVGEREVGGHAWRCGDESQLWGCFFSKPFSTLFDSWSEYRFFTTPNKHLKKLMQTIHLHLWCYHIYF
jgi:hypothetical protein